MSDVDTTREDEKKNEITKTTKQPNNQEVLEIIKKASIKPLREGDTWQIIEIKWFKEMMKYISSSEPGPKPGEIKNASLLFISKGNIQVIHDGFVEGENYTLIHEEGGDLLVSLFGADVEIKKKVVKAHNNLLIEVKPHVLFVSVFKPKEKLKFVLREFSRSTTIKQLKKRLIAQFKILSKKIENLVHDAAEDDEMSEKQTDSEEKLIDVDDIRVWACYMGSPYKRFKEEQQGFSGSLDLDDEETIQQLITRRLGQQICLEVKDKRWPLSSKESTSEFRITSSTSTGSESTNVKSMYSTKLNSGDNLGGEKGVCGLRNLGNTCFMNSSLQCLTKSKILKKYFVDSDLWIKEINETNSLGMGGKMARVFGDLMKELWSGKHSAVAPREFKYYIGKKNNLFAGYGQQDSQELLACLIDVIHEDLNRVKKKEATTQPQGHGRKDGEVANEAWKIHKLRNDSIIVDNFQGQLKSTLVCPNCDNISITFDEFTFLSLPLPIDNSRRVPVTLFRIDNKEPPIQYGIKVSKHGKVGSLRANLSQVCSIKESNLIIADVFNHKIFKFLANDYDISDIRASDKIYAYEAPGLDNSDIHTTYATYKSAYINAEKDENEGEKYFIEIRLYTSTGRVVNHYSGKKRYDSPSLIGLPIVFPFKSKKVTQKTVYDQCLKFVRRYLKTDVLKKMNIDILKPETLFPTAEILKSKQEQKTQSKDSDNDEDEIMREDNDDKITHEDLEKDYLFTLRRIPQYRDYSLSNPILEYNEELLSEKQKQKLQKSSESKYDGYENENNLVMFINSEILQKLVDKDKLEQSQKDKSMEEEEQGDGGGITLEKCIDLFTKKEKLSKQDTWHCPKCKTFVEATKKFDIWKLPKYLIIHLKRFHYNQYTREKITSMVKYPINNFDLSNHCMGKSHSSIYDLYAVSNHYGGLGGGHYTAYAKVDKKWYDFNDSSTSEVNERSVQQNNSAYVLFFELQEKKDEKKEKK